MKLLMETENLKKRVTELENKLNKNSQNSSKPPSSDPPFKKPDKKTKKTPKKRGGQKGHKGHQQKLMTPTSENIVLPSGCACGCSDVIPDSIKERKDENVNQFGKQVVQDLQLLCHWAKSPPESKEWRNFYNRFTELIFHHQEDKNEVGTMARSLIRQLESLWLLLDIVEVEPTNNHAERTLRYGVLWRKEARGRRVKREIIGLKGFCPSSRPVLFAHLNLSQ